MILCKKSFHTSRLLTVQRIGPHDKDVYSLLIGNLLGDAYAEKRKNATRFHIHMSSKNAEYIFWLHTFFKKKGYCSLEKPKVKKQIGKNNAVYFSIKFRTFSFSSFNWIYDGFYIESKKTIPIWISNVLTEKALAIWFMDDGGKSGDGLRICTHCFSYENHVLLQKALFENFSLKTSIHRSKDKYVFYIKKADKAHFSKIVKPHMLNCMFYKLN